MSEIQAQQANGGHDTNSTSRHFICGVVEGFYGKPWTFSQRKDLFKRLKDLNLNSFMYAPKDDAKHRAKWRHLYNEVEANELRILIDAAEKNGIDFYYSLAPGLDMVYSSEEDLTILKQKFDQLRDLGCRSFAILFDDIEPRIINDKDKAVFQDNYAQAQVSVTNMIYEYLGRPKFLFCGTEYCESRAVPSVPESIYLNTIGTGLENDINFMWSGSRVISRFITEESIQELTQVIRRPPVIWENLHANDYDKKRVYLGPYSGRSTKLIPKLRGVLTNPNCEYEANYIAIHTLAQWSRCTEDVNPHNRCSQETQMETALRLSEHRKQPDGQIEQPGGFGEVNEKVYDPDRALARAIRDWLPHVLSERSLPMGNESLRREMRDDASGEIQVTKEVGCEVQHADQVKDIEIEMVDAKPASLEDFSTTDSSNSGKTSNEMDTSGSYPVESIDTKKGSMQGVGVPQTVGSQIIDTNSCDSCEMQDVINSDECNNASIVKDRQKDTQPIIDCIVCSANNMTEEKKAENQNNNSPGQRVDLDSLALVVDFFYLPFEHGLRGHALLSDIKWLVDNSDIFLDNQDERTEEDSKMQPDQEQQEDKSSNQPVSMEPEGTKESGNNKERGMGCNSRADIWLERADRLTNLCNCINRILSVIIHECPNKMITVELYPYLAELSDVIMLMLDYIKFLRHRRSSSDHFYYSSGCARGEPVAPCDEQEPWVHRGGLIGDMQRLIS